VILDLLHAAARGAFPPENGRTEVIGAAAGAPAAVLSFTAHHVVAADVPEADVLERIDPGDLKGAAGARRAGVAGRAHRARRREPRRRARVGAGAGCRLAGAGRRDRVGGGGPPARRPRAPLAARRARLRGRPWHGRARPRARGPARAQRRRGDRSRRDHGLARRLVPAALAAAQVDEPVFAQVAAANAASLRALQPAGFAAVGAEALFGPRGSFLRRDARTSTAAG
jgi:hypothetical protein